MKFSTIVCCSLIAAGSANPAVAGPYEAGMGFRPLVQDQRPRPGPQREAERPAPQREQRGPGEAGRGRMTPDERRQLRRDIQDAGKDIYHPARQGRGDPRGSERK